MSNYNNNIITHVHICVTDIKSDVRTSVYEYMQTVITCRNERKHIVNYNGIIYT